MMRGGDIVNDNTDILDNSYLIIACIIFLFPVGVCLWIRRALKK